MVRSYVEPTPVSPSLVLRTHRASAVRRSARPKARRARAARASRRVACATRRGAARRWAPRAMAPVCRWAPKVAAPQWRPSVGTRLFGRLDSRVPLADVRKLRCKRPRRLAADGHGSGEEHAHSCSGAARCAQCSGALDTATRRERATPSNTPEGVRRALWRADVIVATSRCASACARLRPRRAGAPLPRIIAARSRPAPALLTTGYSSQAGGWQTAAAQAAHCFLLPCAALRAAGARTAG